MHRSGPPLRGFVQRSYSDLEPERSLNFLLPDRYADVWGEGQYAYVGSPTDTGVYIIDISDLQNPSLVTTYGPGTWVFQDVKVHDGISYFSSDDGGGA